MVFFVPGRMTTSGVPSCRGLCTYRTLSSGCCSSGMKSVKLEICGSRRMAASSGLTALLLSSREERESSSSISTRR